MKSFAFGPNGSKINTQPDSQPKKKKRNLQKSQLLLFCWENDQNNNNILPNLYTTETTHPTNPQDFIKSWYSGKSANVKVVRGLQGENVCKLPTKPTLSLHVLSIPCLFWSFDILDWMVICNTSQLQKILKAFLIQVFITKVVKP